jgi:predicted phosphoribosyltransferase
MPFKNRSEAGQKPAGALFNYRDQDSVILALPRGSVPMAAEVAAALDAPLWRTAIVIDDGIATGRLCGAVACHSRAKPEEARFCRAGGTVRKHCRDA